MNYTDQLDKILDRSFKGSYGSDGYISAKMDIEALIHKETQAAREDEVKKLIKQCKHVAEVFDQPLSKQKVTLESIVYYAKQRLKELKATLGGENK